MGVPRTTALSLGPRRPVHRSWCLFDVWMYLCAVVSNSCLKPSLQGANAVAELFGTQAKQYPCPEQRAYA